MNRQLLDLLVRNTFVVPLHCVKEHKRMLTHTEKVLEYNGGSIAINPWFDKLITSSRTAVQILKLHEEIEILKNKRLFRM
jgi:hypothetical protein